MHSAIEVGLLYYLPFRASNLDLFAFLTVPLRDLKEDVEKYLKKEERTLVLLVLEKCLLVIFYLHD